MEPSVLGTVGVVLSEMEPSVLGTVGVVLSTNA